jgi:hypothetical protein
MTIHILPTPSNLQKKQQTRNPKPTTIKKTSQTTQHIIKRQQTNSHKKIKTKIQQFTQLNSH